MTNWNTLLSIMLTLVTMAVCHAQYTDAALDYGILFRAESPELSGGGACFLDYNGDGWIDLYLCGGELKDKLYTNIRGKFYEDDSDLINLEDRVRNTSAVTSADLNSDGCEDIIVGTFENNQASYLLINDCNGHFAQINLPAGQDGFGSTAGLIVADLNGDELLDIVLLNYILFPEFLRDSSDAVVGYAHECQQNMVYINRGDLRFIEMARDMNLGGKGCTYAGVELLLDRTRSGLVYVNDFGAWVWPHEYLTLPDGDLLYRDAAQEATLDRAMYGMGIAMGDIDNDHDIDIYLSDIGANQLLVQNADTFTNEASARNVRSDTTESGLNSTSWGAVFTDVDNDGDPDLFVANGYINLPQFLENDILNPDRMFINHEGHFTDRSEVMGIADPALHRGAIVGDVNHDGKEDILTSRIDALVQIQRPDRNCKLWINSTSTGNHVQLHLGDTPFTRPTSSLLVQVYAGGHHRTVTHYAGGTHASSSSPVVHIGVAEANLVDSVIVMYVDGEIRRAYDLDAGHTYWLDPTGEAMIVGCTDSRDPNYVSDAQVHAYCKDSLSTSIELVPDLTCEPIHSLSLEVILQTMTEVQVIDITGIRVDPLKLLSLDVAMGLYYIRYYDPSAGCYRHQSIVR